MNKAFSLIELLVVMAIIAILSIIAIPQYNKYKVNSAYSILESALKRGELWAEAIVADEEKFPNGVCDASVYNGKGSIRCSYNSTSDTITVDSNGDLTLEIPLKLTFQRNATTSTCGIIIVSCPSNNCFGLKNHDNTGDAKICINTCDNPAYEREDTNLHGLIKGGCP